MSGPVTKDTWVRGVKTYYDHEKKTIEIGVMAIAGRRPKLYVYDSGDVRNITITEDLSPSKAKALVKVFELMGDRISFKRTKGEVHYATDTESGGAEKVPGGAGHGRDKEHVAAVDEAGETGGNSPKETCADAASWMEEKENSRKKHGGTVKEDKPTQVIKKEHT